ncbi:MAG: ATP-binding cassette domain-containing protein [Clostridiaceae bacterium]|nr:ATP-binding cassette domain-containing protein [Clostridiaceae bacterium]
MIEYKNVSFIRDGNVIIDNISFKIDQDENWVVLGPNGAGKSVLFSMLMAYNIPTKGQIKAFGKTFGEYNWNKIKSRIGIVSSTMARFESVLNRMRIFEIILSGLKRTIGIYDRITEAEKEKTAKFIAQLGFESMQYKDYRNLSAGEKKKTMILRSLITEPDILILDEPCSSLDLFQKEQILQTLSKIKNTNMIYITHDITEIIPEFDHVMMLKEGKILIQGKKKEILNQQNLQALYGLDVEINNITERPTVRVINRFEEE